MPIKPFDYLKKEVKQEIILDQPVKVIKIEADFTEANKLLQKILEKEAEPIDISVTLKIE